MTARQFASNPIQIGWKYPVLEGGSIPKRPRLSGQHRHIMPRVEDRFIPAKAALMDAYNTTVLTQFDPIRISPDLDRTANSTGCNRVFIAVEAYQVLETDAVTPWNPSNLLT